MKQRLLTEEERNQLMKYGRLFNDRISSDYDDFVQYNYETINIVRPQAEAFIYAVEVEMLK